MNETKGHYVALDHSTQSVVVAIRGTFHIRDVFTDLVAGYENFRVPLKLDQED